MFAGMHAVYVSEDNFMEQIFSFYIYVSLGDETQGDRLEYSRLSYLRSHHWSSIFIAVRGSLCSVLYQVGKVTWLPICHQINC